MKVAVAGGSGQIGSEVVAALEERGDEVVVLARGRGVDLTSGDGVDGALVGVEAIVDCTSTPSTSAEETAAFFEAVARTLQEAGARAGVRRVVTLSIVGIERMADRDHYAGKLAQERTTRAGAVPATILRATQFHSFGARLISRAGPGPVRVPEQPVQPVDPRTVADHLVRLAHGEHEGETVELAGPQRLDLVDLVRATAHARGTAVDVVPVRGSGDGGRAARRGAALPGLDAIIDGPAFDEWLARQGS